MANLTVYRWVSAWGYELLPVAALFGVVKSGGVGGGDRPVGGLRAADSQVFPGAQHHECLFHALQEMQAHFKAVSGAGYAETHPEAEALKQQTYPIFDARTQRTAQKRYREVLALREPYEKETPAAATIFDFLERHRPRPVNGIESDLIPRTNNAVELVIRRFDRHYQNFCGFESIESAQLHPFLARRPAL